MTDMKPTLNPQNRSARGMDNFNKAPPGWSFTQPKGCLLYTSDAADE